MEVSFRVIITVLFYVTIITGILQNTHCLISQSISNSLVFYLSNLNHKKLEYVAILNELTLQKTNNVFSIIYYKFMRKTIF